MKNSFYIGLGVFATLLNAALFVWNVADSRPVMASVNVSSAVLGAVATLSLYRKRDRWTR